MRPVQTIWLGCHQVERWGRTVISKLASFVGLCAEWWNAGRAGDLPRHWLELGGAGRSRARGNQEATIVLPQDQSGNVVQLHPTPSLPRPVILRTARTACSLPQLMILPLDIGNRQSVSDPHSEDGTGLAAGHDGLAAQLCDVCVDPERHPVALDRPRHEGVHAPLCRMPSTLVEGDS